jgi:hypothetical protein
MNEPVSFRDLCLRVICILVIFTGFNAGAGLILDRARNRCQERESGLINSGRKAGAEVLILGSSRAKHHFDERILADEWGVSVYNAGFSGQGVAFARIILEQIAKYSPPKTVLLDVMPFEDDLDRVHALDPWYFESDILQRMPSLDSGSNAAYVEPSAKTALLMSLPLLRYAGQFSRVISDKAHFGERAFFEPIPARKDAPAWPALQKKLAKPKYIGFEPQLEALIDEAAKVGSQVILTFSPCFPGVDQTAILEPAARIAAQKGVPFLEFPAGGIPELNSQSYFEDYVHMNENGARLFSGYAAKTLAPLLTKAGSFQANPDTSSSARPSPKQ